ncbi:ImpA family metalloprotease [Shewanella corallii]|uniref:ImpA family metalloprotease n=1 Tax=Shewanella corallii TaxID=560080 RepID=A0ABT0N8D4_9GAMM|nr:ImpA family metalloprotease [Shewanella corallii]MCL2914674.1 ImpA family metalloprotease [Shewanella corallii]
MRYTLVFGALTLALTGCGGGSSDEGNNSGGVTPPPTPTLYQASTQTGTGGQLQPTSLEVESGKQGSFTIAPDSGYVLEQISGCGGNFEGNTYTTSNMTADCDISASFITNAENAVRQQSHKLASAEELIAYARGAINTSEQKRKDLVDQIFQGVSKLTWHPTHDSITFTGFLPETTFTLLPSNISGNGDSAVRGLVIVSELDGNRSAAMGSNLFSVNRSPETDTLLKGLIGWLTQANDAKDGLSIVTAQVPSRADSWYFPHNEGIRSWLAEHYPDAHAINDANSCDYAELGTCIDTLKPDLIVLSDIDRESLGHQGIKDAVEKAQSEGIPLLLSNYRRHASNMLSPLYQQMGLATHGNYWQKLQVDDLSVATIKQDDVNLRAVDTLLANMQSGNFTTSLLDNCRGNFINCGEAEFTRDFKGGADWLRNAAATVDRAATNAFTLDSANTLKASLLLADKYRETIDYPIAWEEHQAWQQAMFSDWLVNYARPDNSAQPDLGEYITERGNLSKGSNAHYQHPETTSGRKTISVPYPNQWTTTGWYVLPGQTVTLTRHDRLSSSVEIKLNYHRPNTNRAFEQKVYRGPLELATQRLPLTAGESVSFSSPYGGPLYLYFRGGEGEQSADISASGIALHPSIMDFSDQAQIQAFNDRLAQTELPHIDLRSFGAEQHMRRDKFENAVGGSIPNVNALLKSISEDHINAVYTLAGYKIQGKTLAQSLPADVSQVCVNLLGQECLDEALHTRSIIQHANYDQNAHCGWGCSGNPWDAGWNISPTGWGDNHELGHNLQTNRLNVQYASEANADYWAGYGSRAGENSNNIFPYVVKWQAHYLRDGNTDVITDGHMNHKDLFYVFMSDATGTKNSTGERVVLGANCNVLDQGSSRYEAPWYSNNYAIHNGYRMAFYIQMALRAHGMEMTDGTRLANGFNIFTLLYQHQRIFGHHAKNPEQWDANKDQLGFGLFPYQGHTVYGGRSVRDIPGNDFMLVSLSRLTGMDWRNHFDLLGLRYSSLAATQTQANSSKGVLPMGMYILETDLPPANMSEGLTFLPLSVIDGTTVWRDGSSPSNCPIPQA